MLSRTDVIAIVAMIAGLSATGADSAFGDAIDTLAPGWGKKVVAAASILSFLAGLVLRTMTSNANVAAAGSAAAAHPTVPASPEKETHS